MKKTHTYKQGNLETNFVKTCLVFCIIRINTFLNTLPIVIRLMDKIVQKSRKQDAELLRCDYPTYIPVTLTSYKSCKLPQVPNKKLLLPPKAKIQQVISVLSQRLKQMLGNEVLKGKSIYIFNANDYQKVFYNPGWTIQEASSRPGAIKEGWLDLTYNDHDSF